MLIETQIPHSYTVLCETGHIQVRLDNVIMDNATGEVKARSPWRGVVDPGDTARANKLLGDQAGAAMELAGQRFGGWDKLEQARDGAIRPGK